MSWEKEGYINIQISLCLRNEEGFFYAWNKHYSCLGLGYKLVTVVCKTMFIGKGLVSYVEN